MCISTVLTEMLMDGKGAITAISYQRQGPLTTLHTHHYDGRFDLQFTFVHAEEH